MKLGRLFTNLSVAGIPFRASTVTAGQCAGPRTAPVLVSDVSYAHTRVFGEGAGNTCCSTSFMVTVRNGWAWAFTLGRAALLPGPNTGSPVVNPMVGKSVSPGMPRLIDEITRTRASG